MRLPEDITKLLLDKSGFKISTPSLGDKLSDSIFNATGERLGANTIKRLLGFFSDSHVPHRYTLDVIAHYLGYDNYGDLERKVPKPGSRVMGEFTRELVPEALPLGAVVTIAYAGGRELSLRYNGGELFSVVSHESGHLQKGDVLKIRLIKDGLPLVASELLRDGKPLGAYLAGERDGIKILDVL